jgi:hypothetical protein
MDAMQFHDRLRRRGVSCQHTRLLRVTRRTLKFVPQNRYVYRLSLRRLAAIACTLFVSPPCVSLGCVLLLCLSPWFAFRWSVSQLHVSLRYALPL